LMVCKKILTGGFLSARLFYLLFFAMSFLFSFLSLPINGEENNFLVRNVSSFEMSKSNDFLLISVSCQDKSCIIPEFLKNYLIKSDNKELLLKIPLEKKPSVKFENASSLVIIISDTKKDNFEDVKSEDAPSYPLGSGDVLEVEVYDLPEMKKEVTVDPEGFITLPVIDKLKVQGITINELQRLLENKLGEYIKDPQVNIQLREYGSRFVNVIGEVTNPRRISLKRAFRLLDAISEAGGFTQQSGDVEVQRRNPDGSLRKIVIKKDSLLSSGNGNDNIFVFDQDTVNVLPMSSVYVSGQVKSPKSITYERNLTLLKAIALAGGFGDWANKDKIVILREKQEGGTETIKVDAEKIAKGKIDDIPLQPNDHIIVNERKLF
jgi:polysaccharide export outer membrane protein